jgi:hypothetical protein
VKIKREPIIREQTINGKTYRYEDHSYWDKQKKSNEHKRVYLGRLDKDGTFIPNKTFQQRQNQMAKKGEAKNNLMVCRK